MPAGTSESPFAMKLKSAKASARMINKLKIPRIRDLQELLEFEKRLTKYKAQTLPLIFALLKKLAYAEGKPVYRLFGRKKRLEFWHKIVGGGKHARSKAMIQEFLVGVRKFERGYKVHEEFGKKYEVFGRDLEGGWVTAYEDENILTKLRRIWKGKIGLDVAANSFYKNGKYGAMKKMEYVRWLEKLVDEYKISYLEDPFVDACSFSLFKEIAIGDDITATNPELIEKNADYISGVIIKPNQAGYLYLTLEAVERAREHGLKVIFSHRSQDTCDAVISHLAIALGDAFKIGLYGGERVAKLNEIIFINEFC